MIALDANLIIDAAKRHRLDPSTVPFDELRLMVSAERLVRRRTRLTLGVNASAIGEALAGVKSPALTQFTLDYLGSIMRKEQMRVLPNAPRQAAQLIRAFPERKPKKFRLDAMAYASAAVARATAFATQDRGFIGVGNKAKVLARAKALGFPSQPEPIMPDDPRIGCQINPKKRRKKPRRDSTLEHRRRAWRLAARYVGHDPIAQAEFFANVARAFFPTLIPHSLD